MFSVPPYFSPGVSSLFVFDSLPLVVGISTFPITGPLEIDLGPLALQTKDRRARLARLPFLFF